MKSLIHCVRIVVPYSGFHTSTLYKSCSDDVVHPEKVIDIYTCTRLVFWFLCILHTTGKIMLNTWRYTILKWQDFQRNTRKFTNISQVVASAFRLAKKTLLAEYLLTKLLKKPLTKILQTVMASFVVKITFVVTEISFLGADIRLLDVKITSVAAEMTFKVAVITSSVDKISLFAANIIFVLVRWLLLADIGLLVAKIIL